jgi:uncharacterized protein (DUF1330 family)
MTVYLIADVKVTDDTWIPDYAANVHNIVHSHGGKYLSRSGNITTIEGEELGATLVNDPAYAKYRKARQAGSISRLYVIDDTDIAGTIPYLPKG